MLICEGPLHLRSVYQKNVKESVESSINNYD